MPRGITKYPKVLGVRVTPADEEKLRFLCEQTQCTSGELLRLFIRMAQPTDVPRVVFATPLTETHSENITVRVED